MISYVKLFLNQNQKSILIVSDDTDVLVWLVYFTYKWKTNAAIRMKRPCDPNGKVIDINATATKLGVKCLQLICMYTDTGCHVVCFPFGNWKVTALLVVKKHDNLSLHLFVEQNVEEEDVMAAGRYFFNLLYGSKSQMSLNALRHDIYISHENTPKLPVLPSTDEVSCEHFKRAHLQSLVLNAAEQINPQKC